MESKGLSYSHGGRTKVLAGALPLAIAAFLVGVLPSLASAAGFDSKAMRASELRKIARQDPNLGTMSTVARHATKRGYLVPNRARYHRQKVRAKRYAAGRSALTAPVRPPLTRPRAPTRLRQWAGINDPTSTPPDETGAVGTTRYIELVNSRFAIYRRTGNAPIRQGTLNSLGGATASEFVFDPQVIWDPTTRRFYYAMDDVISQGNNAVLWGWSKTASPTTSADWCKYGISTGTTLADYPKLGDSRFFGIIGTNLFNANEQYAGSNILAFRKPGAGTSCPAPRSANKGISRTAFTPVPANEIDTNAIGWAVARSNSLPGTRLSLFKITRAANGNPVIGTTPTNVNVPGYTVPPAAPQKGQTHRIDTSDTRNTQAVAGIDPAHGGRFAIWTQHTTRGGAGAEVRWYEINPAAHSVIQKGKATNRVLFEFNGAISPNRRVNGTTRQGGNAMVMHFNTTSATRFPSIRMASKIGRGAQSGQVVVKNGTRPLGGFDCASPGPCRWGDYAAATPDPSAANRIWNVSQYGVGSASTAGPATSRTWNFIAMP